MANLTVSQRAPLPENPYDKASVWETVQRYRHLKHPEKVNRCFLSKQRIEIPSREFTIQSEEGRVDYDIYRLALHVLKGSYCNFPGSDADFQRFLDKFNLKETDFTKLWGEESQTLLRFDIKRGNICGDLPCYGDGLKASARFSLFAYRISGSQRSILNRYTDDITSEEIFKKALLRRLLNKPSGCLDYESDS